MVKYRISIAVTATLTACVTPLLLAQSLPYNPTFLLQGQNDKIYQFQDADPQFAVYDATNNLKGDTTPELITSKVPYLTDSADSFIPVATRNGVTVFTGECSEGEQQLNLWTYGFGPKNQTWTQMKTTSSDSGLSANYLSAGFAFPNENDLEEDSLYVFGGMCPNGALNSSSWTSDAEYSNTMLTISPETGDDYEVSLTGTRSPPVAEAGLTITPLLPVSLRPDNTTQQQNFVLIGGHTKAAFIDMLQVAIFSMPQQSWAFVGVDQPGKISIEPRSGHSAAISSDGSRIIVFGGWVGSITNPATPPLMVLEIGQGYGGNGSWSWTVPDTKMQYPNGAQGSYGHAAIMLPGDVMMVTGGQPILTASTSTRAKRATSKIMFYNVSSSAWTDSYVNPLALAATRKSAAGLSSKEKTGIGAGLGLGITALIVIAIAAFIYNRRKREQKRLREKHLREMALGTNDMASVQGVSRNGSQSFIPGLRTASWGAREEHSIGGSEEPVNRYQNGVSRPTSAFAHGTWEGNTDGDIPHVVPPPSALKNSLRSRGPPGFGNHNLQSIPGVFTIEEVEERSERGSLGRRPESALSRPLSDPFKDPLLPQSGQPEYLSDEAAQQRKKEVQTWVDDWQTAAESMSVSRSPSKATSYGRTYSTLSALQSSSSSSGDRTNSNLSDHSNSSGLSKSHGSISVSRTASQRSGSASYALFSTAAAAMSRLAGRQDHATTGIERSTSKRAVSTGDLAQMAARKRSNSIEQNNPVPLTPQSREDLDLAGSYFTPLESPIKDYKGHGRKRSSSANNFSQTISTSTSNSLTNQSRKALGALSSGAKRILTGTGGVSVLDKVSTIEAKDQDSHTTHAPIWNENTRPVPEMAESSQRQVSSSGASFWKHKQGARDWEDPNSLGGGASTGTVRRRSGRPQTQTQTRSLSQGPSQSRSHKIDGDDTHEEHEIRDDVSEDWDVEAAVQQRVVQVMFTVPKERLRVVNADNLSLLSRSDTQTSRNSNKSDDMRGALQEKEINRMSRVTETGEEVGVEGMDDEERTVVGSSLHPDSALFLSDEKGKQPAVVTGLRPRKSGDTIGKAM